MSGNTVIRIEMNPVLAESIRLSLTKDKFNTKMSFCFRGTLGNAKLSCWIV